MRFRLGVEPDWNHDDSILSGVIPDSALGAFLRNPGITFNTFPVDSPYMETRTVTLTPMKAELVSRLATQKLRQGDLTQPEEDAARELRKDIVTAETVQKLG